MYPEIFKSADAMYTMLLMTGYLKVISSRNLNAFFKIYEFGIPILEIQAVYQKEVLNHIAEFNERGDLVIQKYGIAFCGKEVRIKKLESV